MSYDAGNSLSGLRLKSMVEALGPGSDGTRSDEIRGFHYMSLSTLTNLLAMVLHPHPDFPPDETSLIVIDDINTIVDADFPRLHQFVTASRTEQQKWQAGRRYAVLGSLMSGLHKFAALHDIAVIVSTGCSTRGRSSSGLPLALVPSVSGSDWEEGVHNKLAVFRDYHAHFVGVQKVQGKYLISREEVGEPGRIISFETTQAGVLTENVLSLGNGKAPVEQQMSVTIMPSPNKGYKRPYDEIADSEGEEVDEYGWAEADEDVLATESLAVKDTAGLKTDAAN
nr:hypothetical protein CFP56_11084 [Quercus suber]